MADPHALKTDSESDVFAAMEPLRVIGQKNSSRYARLIVTSTTSPGGSTGHVNGRANPDRYSLRTRDAGVQQIPPRLWSRQPARQLTGPRLPHARSMRRRGEAASAPSRDQIVRARSAINRLAISGQRRARTAD